MFLVATPRFQRSVLERRPLPPTADARQALANRIEKDRLYGEREVKQAERLIADALELSDEPVTAPPHVVDRL